MPRVMCRCAIPGHAERFLMSRSLAPQMITADDIMEFDLDCDASMRAAATASSSAICTARFFVRGRT